MKGVVFTEFIELVEDSFGLEVADEMINASDLSTDGAYTTVGTYDHHELIQLITNLSQRTNQSASQLVKSFGHHLFQRFTVGYPTFFHQAETTFDLLASLQDVIHVEVLKLYPDAELPDFQTERNEQELVMTYRSARPFADLAEGLIAACISHYGESIDIHRTDLDSAEGTATRFVLTGNPPERTSD